MSAVNKVVDVTSTDQFQKVLAARRAEDSKSSSSSLVVLYFWASWHPPCTQMNAVVEQIAKDQPAVLIVRVDVDAQAEVAEKYEFEAVPTFLLFKNDKSVATLAGASPPDLVALITAHAKPTAHTHVPAQPPTKLDVTTSEVKLTAAAASSSSSAAADAKTGESKADFDARLTALCGAAPVVVFMKGSPLAPRCGFSRQLVAILNECKVNFGYFDILSDESVREGLKVLSKWPTYPQLYVNGKLIGGLDVVKEMKEEAELLAIFPKEALAAGGSGADLTSRLMALINRERVMLFMKGSPEAPQCGFSRKAVALIQSVGGAECKFGTFDIFSDETVRMGLKEYSKWPTYPQLYIDGKLIGGLDVMNEMNEEGELAPLLKAKPAAAPTATTATAAAAAPVKMTDA